MINNHAYGLSGLRGNIQGAELTTPHDCRDQSGKTKSSEYSLQRRIIINWTHPVQFTVHSHTALPTK